MSSYPTNWNNYCRLIPMFKPMDFGFSGEIGDVNRFAARYRAANSFREVIFEGYSDSTSRGYSALCRVMFVWSAFESFLRIINTRQAETGPLFEQYDGASVLRRIKDLDSAQQFYGFIYERVNAAHKTELDNFRNDDTCNIGYMASAIRHIFAHGHLTPNANGVEPAIAIVICDSLSDFFLKIMDEEFRNRIADFIESNSHS